LSGRGDHTVHMYEVCPVDPFLLTLAPARAQNTQAIALLPKRVCNVRIVEFMRAVRCTDKTVDLMGFRVPRVNKDVFYSDVLPPALVTWKAHLKGREWLGNANYEVQFESLRPEDMIDAGVDAVVKPPAPVKNGVTTRRGNVERLETVLDESETELKSKLLGSMSAHVDRLGGGAAEKQHQQDGDMEWS